jgi:hypothetical protein
LYCIFLLFRANKHENTRTLKWRPGHIYFRGIAGIDTYSVLTMLLSTGNNHES